MLKMLKQKFCKHKLSLQLQIKGERMKKEIYTCSKCGKIKRYILIYS